MKVGVIGAGTMGAGIAQAFAVTDGYEVVLCDIKQEFADGGKARIQKALDKQVAKGRMEQAKVDEIMAKISTHGDNEAVADCDLVVEAAIERMDLKQELFQKLDKICKPVKKMTPRTRQLIDDMFDTMYDGCGVGLAANQVGILKRIVVIDTTGEDPYVLINPEILETSGSQTGREGCLSLPGKAGIVTRPDHVKVKALDENMEEFVLEGDGLLARAICHECDHLDGLMYVSKVEGELMDVEPIEEEEEELE